MDYYSTSRGYVIEGRAFKSYERAVAFLANVCLMEPDEASAYVNRMYSENRRKQAAMSTTIGQSKTM